MTNLNKVSIFAEDLVSAANFQSEVTSALGDISANAKVEIQVTWTEMGNDSKEAHYTLRGASGQAWVVDIEQ